MGFPKGSYPIEDLFSSLASWTHYISSLDQKRPPSTAYHPQTDGQTERVNQEVEHYLRTYTNNEQNDWSEWLSRTEYAHNNRIHSATGYSPFYLNSGKHPHSLPEPPHRLM